MSSDPTIIEVKVYDRVEVRYTAEVSAWVDLETGEVDAAIMGEVKLADDPQLPVFDPEGRRVECMRETPDGPIRNRAAEAVTIAETTDWPSWDYC